MEQVASRVRAADLIALVKPRIMMMALVSAANTLNMYLERDIDCLMARTRNRPLPQHRLGAELALAFGVAQAALAVPLLTFGLGGHAGPLTGLLGVIALISYVMIYTPL